MTIMVTHYMDVNVFKHVLGWQLKWLRILSLGGIDKIRNYLIVNPI